MNKENDKIKQSVRSRYAKIAEESTSSCCCGCSCSDSSENRDGFRMSSDLYDTLAGYESGADLGLGCGLPTRYAQLQPGETVVDLGSGAGNDAFIAVEEVGPHGKVIGIDMTEEMVEKAEALATQRGIDNAEFLLSDIENISLDDNVVECVLSNCVLNLIPDKKKAFSEIFRILKPGGRFCISDIVTEGNLPERVRRSAELYAGCIAGAIELADYLTIIRDTGFEDVEVVEKKVIEIPDHILRQHVSKAAIDEYRESRTRLLSITVLGRKPASS
jgi:ubiquinone/menaquinone biosynthesis C-methylase UbiE